MQEHPNLKKIIGPLVFLLLIVGALFALNTYTDIFTSRINKNAVEKLFKETQEVKDPKGDFSLALPKDWVVNMALGLGPSYLAFFAQSPDFSTASEGQGPDVKVTYKAGASLSALVRGNTQDIQRSNLTEIKSERIKIDAREALLVEYESSTLAKGKILEARVDNIGKRYYFTFGYNPATYPQGQAVLKKILSTIRFLE